MTPRAFERVVIIIFENEYRNYVRRNPFMRRLAAQGIEMGNYFGVMHPSNTNYVASIAGEICNVSEDPLYYTLMPAPMAPAPGPQPFAIDTVVDRIREERLQWRAYMDQLHPVMHPPRLEPVMRADDPTKVDDRKTLRHTILDYPPYLNMHNPFVRFQSITGNREQWERIRTLDDFLSDALDGTLPEYSWITPDIWSDGHWLWGTYDEPAQRAPVLVDQLAAWLEGFFGILKFPGKDSRLPKGTLVVVTFDESDFESAYTKVEAYGSNYDGPNQIYTVLLGDMIPPGRVVEREGYNHYSLLKTIEQNFGLRTLGKNDTDANWFQFLWGREFTWEDAAKTPIAAATQVAAAGLGDELHVVAGTDTLSHRTFSGKKWSAASDVPAPDGTTAVAMAAAGDDLVLVALAGGALSMLTFANDAWSDATTIVDSDVASFALTSFTDYGDQTEKLMLAWSTSANAMQSQVWADGAWGDPVDLTQQTDGDLVLATLGASVFLIYQGLGSNLMYVVSYNTAPFNVVTSAGDSNTTQYAWSPSAFPVAHFGLGPNRATPIEPEPLLQPYRAVGAFAAATLDGVIHLAHRGIVESRVKTTTFSLSGVLTPENEVSFDANATGNSNGFGTLAEAGWSLQTRIGGTRQARHGTMAMGRFGERIALLTQPVAGGALQMTLGGYTRR